MKPDEPAFPTPYGNITHKPGLTKREYFAIKILSGIVSNAELDPGSTGPQLVNGAVILADALIEALNK